MPYQGKDFLVAVENLDITSDDFGFSREKIRKYAMLAINASLQEARKRGADEIRKQVNFPASYFQGDDSRLRIGTRARTDSLEGDLIGRARPTSLARFVTGRRKKGVGVKVNPTGATKPIERGFLMTLRNGNQGLAIRTSKGTRPNKAYKPKQLSEGLWLLYGPSVNQVFNTVRQDIQGPTEDFLALEFQRLLRAGI